MLVSTHEKSVQRYEPGAYDDGYAMPAALVVPLIRRAHSRGDRGFYFSSTQNNYASHRTQEITNIQKTQT